MEAHNRDLCAPSRMRSHMALMNLQLNMEVSTLTVKLRRLVGACYHRLERGVWLRLVSQNDESTNDICSGMDKIHNIYCLFYPTSDW